jgi:hypothetical protein
MGRKLALISAPAGFGKSTLVSEWIVNCGQLRLGNVQRALGTDGTPRCTFQPLSQQSDTGLPGWILCCNYSRSGKD